MIIPALLSLLILIYMIQIEEEELKTKKLIKEIEKETEEINEQFETIQSEIGNKIALSENFETMKQNNEKDLVYIDSIESEISKLEKKNQDLILEYTEKKSELQIKEQEIETKKKEFEEKYNPFVRFLVKYKYIVMVCFLVLISLILYLLPILFSKLYNVLTGNNYSGKMNEIIKNKIGAMKNKYNKIRREMKAIKTNPSSNIPTKTTAVSPISNVPTTPISNVPTTATAISKAPIKTQKSSNNKGIFRSFIDYMRNLIRPNNDNVRVSDSNSDSHSYSGSHTQSDIATNQNKEKGDRETLVHTYQ